MSYNLMEEFLPKETVYSAEALAPDVDQLTYLLDAISANEEVRADVTYVDKELSLGFKELDELNEQAAVAEVDRLAVEAILADTEASASISDVERYNSYASKYNGLELTLSPEALEEHPETAITLANEALADILKTIVDFLKQVAGKIAKAIGKMSKVFNKAFRTQESVNKTIDTLIKQAKAEGIDKIASNDSIADYRSETLSAYLKDNTNNDKYLTSSLVDDIKAISADIDAKLKAKLPDTYIKLEEPEMTNLGISLTNSVKDVMEKRAIGYKGNLIYSLDTPGYGKIEDSARLVSILAKPNMSLTTEEVKGSVITPKEYRLQALIDYSDNVIELTKTSEDDAKALGELSSTIEDLLKDVGTERFNDGHAIIKAGILNKVQSVMAIKQVQFRNQLVRDLQQFLLMILKTK